MASFIKERDFGPVPIFADALGEFYLNELTAIEEQYHKLPDVVLLDAKFKTSSLWLSVALCYSNDRILITFWD
ncbi:hypothetical protein BDV27DRAFT_153028 [Aspergillus caelatus]|uniref:Uncharacterized protein n=1 Tax=Aspergillus caelatus TaxID=61420 RepID=A0A5N7AKH2_9EURO|nr:uncharacterized protein BDV27DRAFT_153028 [Aspergillus caelatus]KAE8369538.1 hypothetical protein BDV27DRAFT_153028 [Aspergillus caelatus]